MSLLFIIEEAYFYINSLKFKIKWQHKLINAGIGTLLSNISSIIAIMQAAVK